MAKPHTINLAGLDLLPDLSGALSVPELSALIISDLHLEQGTSLARRGIRVPPYDTHMTLSLLEAVVQSLKPQRLIFLGDSFHDEQGEIRLGEEHHARLLNLSSAHECFWISGNHDPLPPQNLAGYAADHVVLGPITLRHEPKRLQSGEFEISGHLHPGCGITQRGRRIHGKCFIASENRLIMPAFGAYTGALSVWADPFKRLFEPVSTQVWMLGREALHKFPMERTA